MSDWISREVAIGALEDRRNKYLEDGPNWLQIQMDILTIRALPAVQPDAAAIREAALREAAAMVETGAMHGGEDTQVLLDVHDAILAMIDKPAHVNETPKSEHDAHDVLKPAKGDTHD